MKNLVISLVGLFFGGMSAFANTSLDCTDLVDTDKYVESLEHTFNSKEKATQFYTLGANIISSQQEKYPVLSSFVLVPSKMKELRDVSSEKITKYIEEQGRKLMEMTELSGDKCEEKKEALSDELDKLKKDFNSEESRKILSERGINDIDFSKIQNLFMVHRKSYTFFIEAINISNKLFDEAMDRLKANKEMANKTAVDEAPGTKN